MEQDSFSKLPQEIKFEILSRLRITSIVKCKCVCKAWLDFIKSDEFVESHLSKSKSAPGLALSQWDTSYQPHQILEFIDTPNSEGHILFSFSFGFPHKDTVLHGSANGLLLLVYFENVGGNEFICNPFICNPITREYIRLPSPIETPSSQRTMLCPIAFGPLSLRKMLRHIAFGFGVSNVSGDYKVVAAFSENYPLTRSVGYKFEVYTLGTGSPWRRIGASVPPWRRNECVSLHGKLHWLVKPRRIECFDLETERFSTLSAPELVGSGCRRLCALGENNGLCLYDNNNGGGGDDDDVIWMMKKYGDDKSWIKGFLIKRSCEYWRVFKPIKIFKDGDILFAVECSNKLYRYSTKTKTFREIFLCASSAYKPIYTPSFFPLKTFSKEDVSLF